MAGKNSPGADILDLLRAELDRSGKEAEKSARSIATFARALQTVRETADRAATALRAPFVALQTALNAVQSSVVRFVEKANPAAAIRFNLALDDLQATIGRALLPALNQFTRLLRGIGAAVNGLDANGQKLLAGIAAGTVGLIAFGAAALAVQTIMSGGLLPLFSAVAGAVGGLTFVTADLGPMLKEVGSIFSGVFNRLGAVAAQFTGSGALTGVVTALAEVAGVVVDVGAGILSSLMPAFNVFAELVKVFTPLITTATGAVGAFLAAVVDVWAQGVVFAVEAAAPYLLAFGQLVLQVAKASYDGWRALFSYIGVNLPEFGQTNTPKGDTPDNTGAAARRTSTGNVSDVLARAREAAFGAGTGKVDVAAKSATHLANIEEKAGEIVKGVNKFLEEFPGKVAAALGVEIDSLIENITGSAGAAVAAPGQFVAESIAKLPSVGEVVNAGWDRAASLFP